MNKDLRKVVILLAHPNIKASQANKALIDAVSDIEGVAVFNLYELSEDIAFNVDEWSKIISDTSAVIYQRTVIIKKTAGRGFHILIQNSGRCRKAIDGSDNYRFGIRGLSQWWTKPIHYGRTFAPLSGKCNSLGHGMADPHCDIWNGNRGCGKEHCRRSELVQTKSRNAY